MRDTIVFVLNGRRHTVADVAPHAMALPWLRGQGLLSVKEGCAEGDCGACTIALGEPDGAGGMTWQAVTACILFLGQLDGRAVLTAEGLGGDHAAQNLLADGHGTQCGFCSPGFVMSLFALGRRAGRDRETVLDALAGNLCRCTGYRPIVEAASALPLEAPPPAEAEAAAWLADATAKPLRTATFFAPHTLDDALALRREHPKAWVLAGGTDLGLDVTKRQRAPAAVLSLGRVAELGAVQVEMGALRIGAAVPYVRALDALKARHPGLNGYMRRIGATQIRNMGTLGGNLGTASPIGDMIPPLIALGASVELAGPDGRRTVAVEDFITGYRTSVLAADELIAAVVVPDASPGARLLAYKVARRADQDISAVSAVLSLSLDAGQVAGVRVAYGGVADRPLRARAVEAALIGRPWTVDTARAAKVAVLEDIAPLSDVRGSAEYRRAVAANLLVRAVLDTMAEAAP